MWIYPEIYPAFLPEFTAKNPDPRQGLRGAIASDSQKQANKNWRLISPR